MHSMMPPTPDQKPFTDKATAKNLNARVPRLGRFIFDKAIRVYNRRWFLTRAVDASDERRRRRVLHRFRRVDANVKGQHSEKELLVMADFVLHCRMPGCIVECGCFTGGSSAKLSLLAAETDRDLYICDSFEGLPTVDPLDGKFTNLEGGVQNYRAGGYAAPLEQVQANVVGWGDASRVHYVRGFFCDTLPDLNVAPVLVFSDADLISSTRDVIRHLWPRIVMGGRLYSHDMNLLGLVYGITDSRWWVAQMGSPAPPLFGAGYGCGFGAGSIAYFEKSPSQHPVP
jgi:Macrocin-O-methyltransferase (TylF)